MFRVCLIFYTYDSANLKNIGNNTTKNATRYCAGPAYWRDAQQTFTVQNKPAAVAPKETITHHFFVSGIGYEKTQLMQPKIAGAENVNNEPANIRKWIARFYYSLGIYTPLEARIAQYCTSCPSIWATPFALLINIASPLPLLLHSDQPLRVK